MAVDVAGSTVQVLPRWPRSAEDVTHVLWVKWPFSVLLTHGIKGVECRDSNVSACEMLEYALDLCEVIDHALDLRGGEEKTTAPGYCAPAGTRTLGISPHLSKDPCARCLRRQVRS